MGILDAITAVFKPISDVIDHVLPSGDAKVQLQQAMITAQAAALTEKMDYETKLLDSQGKIVLAEAQGQSWIQRNWRPITMLTFLVLVVCDAFGVLPNKLAPQMWTLMQVGLGGYVVGRSVEKVAPQVVAAVKAAK